MMKLALAVAACRGWYFSTTDINCVFPLPNGQELHSAFPAGHPDLSGRKENVLKLTRTLDGTREDPMIWFNAMSRNLTQHHGLRQIALDPCFFFSEKMIVLTYVVDFLLLGDKVSIGWFTAKLRLEYEITSTSIDASRDFLGILIERCPGKPFVVHQK